MTGRDVWAVVLVKPFRLAKQRLAGVLDAGERSELARVMLEDVLTAVDACERLAGVIVVTADRAAAAVARRHKAIVLMETAAIGMNAAVARVVKYLTGSLDAGMVVVPADLPHVSPEDIEEMIDLIDHAPAIALVRSSDGGTNLLACRPSGVIAPSFGPDSFNAHCDAAECQGITPTVYLRAASQPGHRPARRSRGLRLAQVSDSDARLSFEAEHPGPPLDGPCECAESRAHGRAGWRPMNDALADLSPDTAITDDQALALAEYRDLGRLMPLAAARRDAAHGSIVSYSRKVFVPLTQLCRDVCHYCTFAQAPAEDKPPYLTIDAVLEIARAGQAAQCKEVLFTLGDKPELRYPAARKALERLGHETTLSYLAEAANAVLTETGLLPHVNPGCMTASDLAALRRVSISQGIMLESASERLCEPGGPHHGSPDKVPSVRLETIRIAGEQRVPFTTGILIGIGETRRERVEALLALRALHETYGHLQEIIIQNFRPKSGTRMAGVPAVVARGASVDDRRCQACLSAGDEHSGAAESERRRAGPTHRGGHQRLGWRLAGHAGSRESRSAMAAPQSARARNQGGRQGTRRTACDLPGLRAVRARVGGQGPADEPLAQG